MNPHDARLTTIDLNPDTVTSPDRTWFGQPSALMDFEVPTHGE